MYSCWKRTPVQPGGQPQAQASVPPPIVHPRGNENVQDLVGRKIQKKNEQEKDAQDQPGNESYPEGRSPGTPTQGY